MSRSRVPSGYGGLRTLIVGGGLAAFEAAFALRALAADLVDIELLTPELRLYYRPQAVIEAVGGEPAPSAEISGLAEALGAQLTFGELASVSPDTHVARTSHGMRIGYDAIVIACGASPRAVLHDALTFRGPADADHVALLLRDLPHGEIRRIVIAVPTCRTWPLPPYELAFGLRQQSDVPITLRTIEHAPAEILGRAGSGYLASLLATRDVEVVTDVEIFDDPGPGEVVLAVPELRAGRIYGVPTDEDGFIPVNRHAAVQGLDRVFAAGDCTSGLVKHGSLAAAQADAAAEFIAARAGANVDPRPYAQQLCAAVFCGGHTLYVQRDLDNWVSDGELSLDPLWSPPAKIAARYLSRALVQLAERQRA
jgi:sulfide:quinone oxidoreductase